MFRLGVATASPEVARQGSDTQQGSNGAVLRVRLDPESAARFAAVTRARIGLRALVAIDGEVIMRPMILSAIEGGGLSLIGLPATRIETIAAYLVDGRSQLTVGFEVAPGRP